MKKKNRLGKNNTYRSVYDTVFAVTEFCSENLCSQRKERIIYFKFLIFVRKIKQMSGINLFFILRSSQNSLNHTIRDISSLSR